MTYIFRKFNPVADSSKPFDCGNSDLNGFFRETESDVPNATSYTEQLLAVTYVVEERETSNILAYFSLLHDKLEREYSDAKIWNKLSRKIPNIKRRSSYPALKIGRLAVSKNCRLSGLGTKIVHFIEALYLNFQYAGCRFITVDSLPSAIGFYERCKFHVLKVPSTELSQEEDNTALMFFDLRSF